MSLLEKMKQKVNYKNKRKREVKKNGENLLVDDAAFMRMMLKKILCHRRDIQICTRQKME